MCNACGFLCCAMDCFSGCGCEHCSNPACYAEDDEHYEDENPEDWDDAEMRVRDTGDELGQVLAEALAKAARTVEQGTKSDG